MTLNLLNLEWYGWFLLVVGLTSLTHDFVDSFRTKDVKRPDFTISITALAIVLYLALVPT